MEDFWNTRYSEKNYAYGKEANEFYKTELIKTKGKKILFPAEGEGRNAVYAALNAWDVHAFDTSTKGKEKAMSLAKANGVKITYSVLDFRKINYPDNYFDVIVLIYAHIPVDIREDFHKKMIALLKVGGKIIFEGFSTEQLGKLSGGPKNIAMLFNREMLINDFSSLSKLEIFEEEVELDEGPYHRGLASVIRLLGSK